jgi:integrase
MKHQMDERDAMLITQKGLEKVQAGKERQVFRDDELTGFGVRVESKATGGRKSFFWNQKVNGEVYFRSLGEASYVSVKDARDRAREWAGKASKWKQAGCPASENPFAKQAKKTAATNGAPLFEDLVEAYIRNHLHDPKVGINHPDKAEKELRWALGKYFKAWMSRPVDSFTVEDAIALREAAKKTPYLANRNVQVARALLAWCAAGKDGKVNVWPLLSNVASKVELFPERERERYLSPEEQVILEDALNDPRTPPDLRDFVLLALDTAARKASLIGMQWSEIDFELKQWAVPASRSKSGRGYIVDLLPRAVATLERRQRQRTTSPFVFPPISGKVLHLDKPFRRLMVRIGGSLVDLRIHDLRRSTGSTLAQSGESLEKIAKVLGQESIEATSIYARLSSASIREARESGERKRRELMNAARRRMGQKISSIR